MDNKAAAENGERKGVLCPWCLSETGVETTVRQIRRIIRYRRCKNTECNKLFRTEEKKTPTNSNF